MSRCVTTFSNVDKITNENGRSTIVRHPLLRGARERFKRRRVSPRMMSCLNILDTRALYRNAPLGTVDFKN